MVTIFAHHTVVHVFMTASHPLDWDPVVIQPFVTVSRMYKGCETTAVVGRYARAVSPQMGIGGAGLINPHALIGGQRWSPLPRCRRCTSPISESRKGLDDD